MPIHEFTKDTLLAVKSTTFAALNIKERDDIQRILRSHITAISGDLFVLAEEFGDWEGAWRSIDLLCLDKEANLVVVELKRTEDGGHMELQAIRYAAMISNMRFEDAIAAHAKYLGRIGDNTIDAESAILNFLGWDEPSETEFAKDVRIILVSSNFSKEITTSVLWLNDRDIDIRCVRLIPYQFDGRILLDIQQIIPLPEAAEYQIRLKKKAAEERGAKTGGADWTRYDLKVGSETYPKLYKRGLFLAVVRALVENGKAVSELQSVLPTRKFLGVAGKLSADEFKKVVSEMKTESGGAYDFRRYYTEEADLFRSEGKTWALSNQWSLKYLPDLENLIEKYPEAQISFSIANAN